MSPGAPGIGLFGVGIVLQNDPTGELRVLEIVSLAKNPLLSSVHVLPVYCVLVVPDLLHFAWSLRSRLWTNQLGRHREAQRTCRAALSALGMWWLPSTGAAYAEFLPCRCLSRLNLVQPGGDMVTSDAGCRRGSLCWGDTVPRFRSRCFGLPLYCEARQCSSSPSPTFSTVV